jgi:hypothetical protein
MSAYRDDALLTETLERIRRAELATVLYPPGTPEHARAVERLSRATRQMRRLQEAAVLVGGDAAARPGNRPETPSHS